MTNHTKQTLIEPIGILVEGESDKNFLSKICSLPEVSLKDVQIEKITPRGGKTGFFGKENFYEITQIERWIDKNRCPKKIILICDAYFKENGKSHDGFKKTKSTLQPIISKLCKKYKNVKFDIFIFPNNKDDGNLDSLFLQCATKKIKEKFCCIDGDEKKKTVGYLECVGVEPSVNKIDKLRAELLLSAIGLKDGIKNVGDAAKANGYWDFKHNALEELKKFLLKLKN
jgi:hypothetical protein